MTDVNENTFLGPNQGNSEGYIPQTTIESSKIDADLNQILHDLDYHLALFQQVFSKIDQIDLGQLGDVTAAEIVPVINSSSLKINATNLENSVVTDSELAAAIATHKATTTASDMHPETSIKSTELTYSNTPTTLITTCVNLLDELKNIRYQIHRLNGKTNWSDTPSTSLDVLNTSLNTAISTLTTHVNNATVHLTTAQAAALNAADRPSASNPFATVADVNGLGSGDMTKAVYDSNKDGIIDTAASLTSGTGAKTYDSIVSKIASDIATHAANATAHGAAYTDAKAIGAINNDSDHYATAPHRYSTLPDKPPADYFTLKEVQNIRGQLLANGTAPWTAKADLTNGLISSTQLPVLNPLPSTWNDSNYARTGSFFSAAGPGAAQQIFYGPIIITGGIGVRTTNYSYLQVSVNGGSNWYDCATSDELMQAANSEGDHLRVWMCPPLYIPSGRSFIIRAGSTFGPGTSERIYGGGFYINIRLI